MLEFFTWCENTAIGEAIRASLWLFPVIESFHLLALGVIGGAVLIMNLRLLGWALASHPAAAVWRELRPWFQASWVVMIVSGLLLFFSEALKLYYNEAFWWKMGLLLAATAFSLTATARAAQRDRVDRLSRGLAVVALLLWTGVGAAGRWIGFS